MWEKVVVINAEVNRYEYRHSAYQLVLVDGGHGALRGGRGQAVFGTSLADGKHARWERCDVLGEIKPEKNARLGKRSPCKNQGTGKSEKIKEQGGTLMEIRALTQPEQKYTYAQSMQLEGQTGCIGHLRGDFAPWIWLLYFLDDTREQWKTDEFKSELDDVINALREDKGLLHNRYDMAAFARKNPESALRVITVPSTASVRTPTSTLSCSAAIRQRAIIILLLLLCERMA